MNAMFRGSWRLGLALAVVSILVTACTPVRNPATGEVQYTSLDPQEEIALGREEHPKALQRFGGSYDDPVLQAFIDRIGRQLVSVSELPELTFTFTVLDSEIVNAFALPGGYIYISRGLLALAENEAEVAGVLGHEIGHVTARHSAQRYDRAIGGQLGAGAATIIGGILLGDAGAQLGQQLGGVGAQAYVQGFSREQEFQADQLGIRYLTRAGYDPRAMATFLEKLQAQTALQQRVSGRSGQSVPDWLSSHPRTEARVVEAANSAAEDAPAARTLDPNDFFNAIDGMIYGQSPEQGFVVGRRFEHPVLRFTFEAPVGFELQNTSSAVMGSGPGNAVVQFTGAQLPPGQDAFGYLNQLLRNANVRVLDPTRIDGHEAALAVADVAIDNRPGQAVIGAIEHAPGEAYRFIFFVPGTIGGNQVREFEEAIRSFDSLTQAEAAAIQPLRIDIVTMRPGDTVQSLSTRMAIDHGEAYFRLLNGLDTGGLIQPGDPVKLVVRGGASIPSS